jgi:SAM-dependent methyltransferase
MLQDEIITEPKSKPASSLPLPSLPLSTFGSPSEYGDLYAEVMNWDDEQFGMMTARQEADLKAIIRLPNAAFPPKSRVLEIGFGNGGVLTYGRRRQWEIQGTEVNELLLQRARKKGFSAFSAHGNEALDSLASDFFDLVLAFDVLEHMPAYEIVGLLRQMRRIAKHGAVFIARFPNGDSPFSLGVHLTTLGSSKASYLAKEAGMEIVYLGGEPQPLWSGIPHFCYRIVTNPIRSLLNLCLNLLFYPGNPKPLCSRNLVMVLRVAKPIAG